MSIERLLKTPIARIAIPVATLALAAAACSSGSSSTKAASGGSGTPGTSGASGPSGAAKASSVTLESHRGGPGTFLTDSSGRSLYLFKADGSMTSTCTGACATAWPPLTSTTAATAGTGVTASDIGSISRSDGGKQVTYNGHPLYYFSGDSGAGQTNGQGSTAFGAPWWLVTPSGASLTGSGASSPPVGRVY